MKCPLSRRLTFKLLLLASALVGLQCEKKEKTAVGTPPGPASPPEASTPSGAAPTVKTPPTPAKPPSLAEQAAKLGFAAKLPQETEFYLGSVNLKAHLATLQKTIWWKDINALVQDKTPAPTAGAKLFPTLEKLWGDDFFIAGGPGFAASAAQLRSLERVYDEINFKMLMAERAPDAPRAAKPDKEEPPDITRPNPLLYLQSLLQDPATLDKLAGALTAFEMPPFVAGFKVEKPEEILAVLNDTKEYEEKKIFQMSDHTTPQGHKFRVATIELASLLLEDDEKDALASLPADTPEASRKVIQKAYNILQGKKFRIAWGSVDGHVILACGQHLDHLKFATGHEQSLLAKPELGWLAPHFEKNLAAITYVSAGALEALNNDQPFVPMLRGVVSAMKENTMYSELGAILEKKVTDLVPIEQKVHRIKATNLVAAAWWDRGLHIESAGGAMPEFLLPGKPLRFQSLMNQPGVIFGIAYHRNKEHEMAVRAWLEQLLEIAFTTAKELVKGGIAGPRGGGMFAAFEQGFLPSLKAAYLADKSMVQKGLGTEIGYIVDLNGTMPVFPSTPEGAKGLKFPRLSIVSEVSDREEVAKYWKTVHDGVIRISSAISLLTDSDPPQVPEPQSVVTGDRTTWTIASEALTGDLTPSAVVSDKMLVLSTSKDAAESLAANIAKPPAADAAVDGAVWRFNPDALLTYLNKLGTVAPGNTPEHNEQAQMILKWLKPFHAMQGRLYQENGQWRTSFHWEMSDVVKFD